MDHTPVRRQRSVQNSEAASALETPLRLSSGRRRSLSPLCQDEAPQKKLPTCFEASAVSGETFNSLIDKVADAPSSSLSLQGPVADPMGKQPSQSVSSLLAAQRANRHKLAQQQSRVSPPIREVQSDADVARQCLVRARQLVEFPAHESPLTGTKSAGCLGKGNKYSMQLLVTKSGEMGTEFLFEGRVYRATDLEAFQEVLMKPNVPVATRTVASLRAAQRSACQVRETLAPSLLTDAYEPRGDAFDAIRTLESARKFSENITAGAGQATLCPDRTPCASSGFQKPLLIVGSSGEGVDFTFEGQLFHAPDPSVLGIALGEFARLPAARSLSSIRAAQRVGRHRNFAAASPSASHHGALAPLDPVCDAEAAHATLESARRIAIPSAVEKKFCEVIRAWRSLA